MSTLLPSQTIFFFGATGYLGSQFLILLNEKLPQLHVAALLRNATPQRKEQLRKVYQNISFVEGSLDADAVIQEHVAKVDIVINCASSDHAASVQSTSLDWRGTPKTIQESLRSISGCGIVSDNVRGEPVKYVKEWSDVGLDLRQCDPINTHLDSDIPIVEVGMRFVRTENPVRTIIYFPAQIYGVGEGIQKTTLWLRMFLGMMKNVGYAGTWGPGANAMNNIHVKDCAAGLLPVLQAALEGKADEGAEGIYFAASDEPRITYHEWTKVMGNSLLGKGTIKKGGIVVRCPPKLLLGIEPVREAERLYKLGWEPTETKKLSLLESFPEALEQALEEETQLND